MNLTWILYLLILAPQAYAVDATRSAVSTPRNSQDASNGNFERITVDRHMDLSSFEGNIPGYILSCENEQNGKIGFCGGECNDQAPNRSQGASISRQCAEFLDQHITRCVNEVGCDQETYFCGVGGHARRSANTPGGSSTPSRHSTGDALDLFGLRCKDINGNPINLDLSSAGRSANPEKYDRFVQCWRDAVHTFNQGNRPPGGAIACQGATPPTNHLHNDHVHISCPVQRSRVVGI